jgi:hypothetical protein
MNYLHEVRGGMISSERDYFLIPPDDEEDRSPDLPPSYQSIDTNRGTLEEREIKNIKRWLKHYDTRIRTTDDTIFKNSYIREKAKMEKRLEKALSDNFDSDNSKTLHGSGQTMSAMPGEIVTAAILTGIGLALKKIDEFYKDMTGTSILGNIWNVVAPIIEQYGSTFLGNMSDEDDPIKEIFIKYSSKFNQIMVDFPKLGKEAIPGNDSKISELYPKIFELKIIMDLFYYIYNIIQVEHTDFEKFKENIKYSKQTIDNWLANFKDGKKPDWKQNETKSFELMNEYLKIKRDIETNKGERIVKITKNLLDNSWEYKHVYPNVRNFLQFQINERERLKLLNKNPPSKKPPSRMLPPPSRMPPPKILSQSNRFSSPTNRSRVRI